ncbi:MAG: 50S ribosomal protein L11 methyltransferase [Oligoflexia bacterium]|nr:50S ribosomal protein L11 methyltransferase [Oligoflexia bacterium]
MSSYFYKLKVPKALADDKRELFSSWLVKLAERWSFQGIEDWQIDLHKNEFVLGIENEFYDLRGHGKSSDEIIVYFGKKTDALNFKKTLHLVFADLKISSLKMLKKTDWMKEWRKHYKTTKIQSGKNKIYIVPAWKKKPKTNSAIIKIYPGQAFGTGTHSTTKLCTQKILELSDHLMAKQRCAVLDFGAGTAILALATNCFLPKKRSILAVESDPVALEQARKNIRLNRADITAQKKISKGKKYDLILANVLSPVLLSYEKYFSTSLNTEGLIVLSGILKKDAESFFHEFNVRKNWVLLDTQIDKDWCALTAKLL